MIDDRELERILDDQVPLAAEGLFITGVDPPWDDGGPVIVTLATDDPAHAEQLMRVRYGDGIELDVTGDAPYSVQREPLRGWREVTPGVIEVDLRVPSGVTIASLDVFEDDTTVVVAAFALWPPSVKLPGVPTVTRRIGLSGPLGERELRDAGQAWRPKPGASHPFEDGDVLANTDDDGFTTLSVVIGSDDELLHVREYGGEHADLPEPLPPDFEFGPVHIEHMPVGHEGFAFGHKAGTLRRVGRRAVSQDERAAVKRWRTG